jgi:hypothetical protein
VVGIFSIDPQYDSGLALLDLEDADSIAWASG